ncbi:amidohydrolase family protein [Blautia stercoris]
MEQLQIWDSHVHLFPPEIYNNWETYAARDSWFGVLTKKPENHKGTEEAWANAEEALDCATQAGIHGLVMQGWYWNDAGLMRMHNDYMAESMKNHPERLKGFISINPKFKKEAIAEIERCAKLGFSGIGELGPGGNGYDFNDPDFIEVVECANAYHLPINIHCGEPVGHPYPGKDMTSLAPLPGLILKYPDVTFILAHMGGGLPFYELNPRYHGKFKNVYYDTAANPLLYHISSFRAVIGLIGSKRLLYGSDFPLLLYPSKNREMDFSMFVNQIRNDACLSKEEWNDVMGNNLRRVLDI